MCWQNWLQKDSKASFPRNIKYIPVLGTKDWFFQSAMLAIRSKKLKSFEVSFQFCWHKVNVLFCLRKALLVIKRTLTRRGQSLLRLSSFRNLRKNFFETLRETVLRGWLLLSLYQLDDPRQTVCFGAANTISYCKKVLFASILSNPFIVSCDLKLSER